MGEARPIGRETYRFIERIACPSCRSVHFTTEYRCNFTEPPISTVIRDGYGIDPLALAAGEYRLDRCAECDLLFQALVGSDDLLSDLYTDWVSQFEDPERDFPRYREDVEAPLRSRDGHEIMSAASYLGIRLDELKLLDFGMGRALWSRIGVSLGCRTYGTDLADSWMDFARAHGVTTITEPEIATMKFHFINADQVLEHVSDPWEVVRKLSAALEPGGILKVSVPSRFGIDRLLRELKNNSWSGSMDEIMPVHPLEHLNCFSMRSLAALGAQHGLAIVRPGYRHRFAFLRTKGAISLRHPKNAARELVRPWHEYHNPRNLYVWLQKPSA